MTDLAIIRTAQAEDFDYSIDDSIDQVTVTRAKQGDLTKTLRQLAYMTWGTDASRADFIHEAMVRGVNKTTAGVCWAAGRTEAQNAEIADEAMAGWMSGALSISF
jgi:hypothetical protein